MAVKDDSLVLIVLENISEFGEKVNAHLKKERKSKRNYIIPIEQVRFSNGEGKIVLRETVRAKDVYILADIGNHEVTYDIYGKKTFMTPDEHFQDIKRAISAIKGHAAKTTVIMPLLYESRQHGRNGRESLDCAIALQELERMGIDGIVTVDAHDPNVENAIPLLSFDNFYPTHTILSDFIEHEHVDFDNLLIISPDEGAVKRSRYYADMLRVDLGLFYKRRDYSKVINGKNPIVEQKYLGKEQEGLDYIIVDDMIASGGSVIEILHGLEKRKARDVYVIAPFTFFTEGTEKFDRAYEAGLFKKLYSTNLSYIPEVIRRKPWFHQVDCSAFVASIINTFHNQQPISPLLNGKKEMFNKIIEFKKNGNKE